MSAIKAVKMTKKYNGVTVVNGIDLTIEEGELFGLRNLLQVHFLC